MGYRFTMNEVNLIAHLIDGNAQIYVEEITHDIETFQTNIYYLNQFAENFSQEYMSGKNDAYIWAKDIQRHLRALCKLDDFIDSEKKIIREQLIESISSISIELSRCRYKAIICPAIGQNNEKTHLNKELCSKELLRSLVYMHPGNSCLILQPREIPNENSISVFSAFRNFEVALDNIDMWPGVLIWDGQFTEFFPISSISNVEYLFSMMRHPAKMSAFRYLLGVHGLECMRSSNNYIFHLSDLHIGRPDSITRQIELYNSLHSKKSEISKHLSSEEGHNVEPNIKIIITGDLMDSPSKKRRQEVSYFLEMLRAGISKDIVFTLGNHDVNKKGLAVGRSLGQIASSLNNNPMIECDDVQSVLIANFNSCMESAFLAQGAIGEFQFSEIGRELEDIKNAHDYLRIAILHHHVIPVERPDWYHTPFYLRLFGEHSDETLKLIDSDMMISWLKDRGFEIVLHGHKHIPQYKCEDGIIFIGCGSSTGAVHRSEKGKTYISFNMLRIDSEQKKVLSCIGFYKDQVGTGLNHVWANVL